MAGQPSYLPEGLPYNRALWPPEYRDKEQLDLVASRLIKQLKLQKISREKILHEIDIIPAEQREFFRERLNYWREVMRV